MQVNPEDGPPEIHVTWSDPRMTDFENCWSNNQIQPAIDDDRVPELELEEL